MTDSFAKQIQAMVDDVGSAMIGVVRQSIQDVINEAQLVGPSKANPAGGKGGRMPVDTGFLRASGRSSLTGMPSGPTIGRDRKPGETGVIYPSEDDYNTSGFVRTTLAKMGIGDTFYFGWSADYANKMETYYGFLGGTVQN